MPVRPANRGGRPAARKAAPAKTPVRRTQQNLTEYIDKPATPYHKAFANWLVKEVGYTLASPAEKKAFLAGIRLAVTTRNLFNASDYIEEWREKTGEVKRGRKPAAAQPTATSRKRRPEPEPEEDDEDDFEEDEDSEEEDDSDDFDEDDSEEDEDDEDFDEEEEEPAPAPKRRAPAKAAAPSTRTAGGKTAPARKPAGRPAKSKPPADEDDFIF